MTDGIEAIVAFVLAIGNFLARFVAPLLDQFRKTDFDAFRDKPDDGKSDKDADV